MAYLPIAAEKANIAKAKELLIEEKTERDRQDIEDGNCVWEKQDAVWTKIMYDIKRHSKLNCPACKKTRMRFAGIVPPSVALE